MTRGWRWCPGNHPGAAGEVLSHKLGTCSCDTGTRAGHSASSRSLESHGPAAVAKGAGKSPVLVEVAAGCRDRRRWGQQGHPPVGTAAGGGSAAFVHPGLFSMPFFPNGPEPASAPHAGAGDRGRGRWGALTFNSEEDLGIYVEMKFKNSCPGANKSLGMLV